MKISYFGIVGIIKAHIPGLVETLKIDSVLQKPAPSLYFPTDSLNILNFGINLPYVAFMTYLYACIFCVIGSSLYIFLWSFT